MPLAAVALGVGSMAAGIYSSNQASKAADQQANIANSQVALQAQVANKQLDLANQQWDLYKSQIFPLEQQASQLGISAQQLAKQRGQKDLQLYNDYYAPLQQKLVSTAEQGITPQIDRVRRQAALDVDKQFAAAKNSYQVGLSRRGIQPDSGAALSFDRQSGLQQGAARADAMNTAAENEIQRARTQGFNEMATALGRQPTALAPSQSVNSGGLSPATVGSALNGAGYTAGSGARTAADMTSMYGNAAAGAMQGGLSMAGNIYKLANGGGFNFGNWGSSVNAAAVPSSSGVVPGFSSTAGGLGAMPTNFGGNYSAVLGPTAGYATGGLVEGPPGHDQVPARLTAGEVVIPKGLVEKKGTDFFQKMIDQYYKGAPAGSGGLQHH